MDIINQLKIRSDKFMLRQDIHIMLELLKNGYANGIYNAFTYSGESNTSGGCSEYRTRELMQEEREEFCEYHAPFVTTIDKKKEWGGKVGSVVPEVLVQWKKCYQSYFDKSKEQVNV